MKILGTIAILLFTACSSSGGVGIEVKAVTNDDSAPGANLDVVDEGATSFRFQESVIYVRHIQVDLFEEENSIDIDGPFLIDLVTGTSTPSLDDVEIPEGTYKRVDIRVDDSDDQLDGNSFVAVAQFEYDGAPVTLDLGLHFNEDIRIEHPDGVALGPDTDLVAEFVVNDWLADVDIAECIDDDDLEIVDGVLTINESVDTGACSAIENTIKENMKRGTRIDD